ncbi:MAG: BatA domain-containing protein [Rubripirellula sp.]
MSLLAPLYIIGAFAIGAPILFHLIRRQPKGQVPFSSLMFLKPTPPRLTRRSRLDNWFLLLLRALALILLATAFARPFLRSVTLSQAEIPGRRLVIVVDQSASMQREGIWKQVVSEAERVLSDLQPADELAVVAFDDQPHVLLGFEETAKLTPEQLQTSVPDLLESIKPSWLHGEMGNALAFAGDLAVSHEIEALTAKGDNLDDSETASLSDPVSATTHLILISDMAAGSELDSLQTYAWPKTLRVDVRRVVTDQRTNASAQILESRAESAQDLDRVRVRVSNSGDATSSRFSMRWAGGVQMNPDVGLMQGAGQSVELPIQVPPGQSRVVRMPMPGPGMTSLVLTGDDHDFDNRRFVVTSKPQPSKLLHLGKVMGEPRENLLFYLQRIPFDNKRRIVTVETREPAQFDEPLDPVDVPLLVVTAELSPQVAAKVRKYCEVGGRVLFVLPKFQLQDSSVPGDGSDAEKTSPESSAEQSPVYGATVNLLSDSTLKFREADIADYSMLSRIDFSNPLFQTMADPQFNDFSKIRFWAHRVISDVDQGWQVVAQFDDGDPAVLEKKVGEGRLFVLASGWQPSESQLALSTKFLPLMFSFFEAGGSREASEQYTVGQVVAFPKIESAQIVSPSGDLFDDDPKADQQGLREPGIYQFQTARQSSSFAVNLNQSESRTEPLDDESLAGYGVLLGDNLSTADTLENERQLRDRELESQQRLWQWILVLALALLGLETLLGTLWSRRGQTDGVPAVETG